MLTRSLTDDKGYNAQINCELILSDGSILFAGEDGLIKIFEKERNKEINLEKMLDKDGYLDNIEECVELKSGDIVCVTTLGNVGVYKKEENYKQQIIINKSNNDCFYYLKSISEGELVIWGELGEKNRKTITIK